MDVADPREEMVLDLEIQASDDRRQQPVVPGEIDGRFDLVNGPGRSHPAGVRLRDRKSRIFDAMCQLKDDAQHESLYEGGRDIQWHYHPQWVEPQRDDKCQQEKRQFAPDQRNQVPTLRACELVSPDPTRGDIPEVVVKL